MNTTTLNRSTLWFATGVATTLLASVVVVNAWSVGAAPGNSDTTYVPVEPCRLFDTRPSSNAGPRATPVDADVPHTQQVAGTNGNCVIPTDAAAVAMNVRVAIPTAKSDLRLYPADLATPPLVSNLNWSEGQVATPNKVDVKLSMSARSNS